MRLLITLIIVGALVFVGATVKLGKYTFFGHVQRIWHTPEAEDLKQGTKETVGPAEKKIERGVKAGVKAMEEDPAKGDAGAAHAKP